MAFADVFFGNPAYGCASLFIEVKTEFVVDFSKRYSHSGLDLLPSSRSISTRSPTGDRWVLGEARERGNGAGCLP